MHQRVLRISACVAVALAAACGGSNNAVHSPIPSATPAALNDIIVPAGAPISIGVSAALSGDQMNLGLDITDAADLAATELGLVRGRSVRIVRMDDRCADAEEAVAVARDLIEREALVGVIGPMCTTGAQAANSVYEAAGVVHISPSATRVDLSAQGERFFFRTTWRDDVQAATQATYAYGALGAESAIVIDDGDPYGKGLADAFQQEFEARGGRVLTRERIERGETDFSGLVRQILSAEPEIVVYEGLNPEGALLINALREIEYGGVFMGPDGLLSVRDFLQTAGEQAEGAVLTGGPTPDEAFALRFGTAFGRLPGTPFVLQSHDAVGALLSALNAAATDGENGALVIDRQRLAETLRTQTYNGLTGAITFDERGDRVGESAAELGLTIYRVDAGRFVPVE